MANVALNDIMLLTISGTIFQQRFMLTHTYACTAVTGVQPPLTAQGDLADKVKAGGTLDIVNPYVQCLSTNAHVDRLTTQILSSERMRATKVPQDADGEAGSSNVTNLATGLTFVTQKSGRNQIATKHIGPLAEGTGQALIDGGMLTDTYKGELEDLGVAMLSAPQTNTNNVTWTPCIVHRNPETGAIVGHTVIDNFFLRGIVSSQRTRTVGKGE